MFILRALVVQSLKLIEPRALAMTTLTVKQHLTGDFPNVCHLLAGPKGREEHSKVMIQRSRDLMMEVTMNEVRC